MSSIVWLGLTVILVVVVAVTGIAPKGGKPVARSRLMKGARVVLVLGIIAFAAMGISGILARP
ncbi:MAG: hypothetical protein H7X95_08910 [Deltaproteobacteria bacterium]|nr:hypothetical protein [Deltaproteobacteria bacterium]